MTYILSFFFDIMLSKYILPQPDLQSLLHSFFQGFAEDLSQFQDNSFDVVIETLVLCSVNDVDQSLREIHRVLKPGGIFCFLDHVKAPDSTWLLRFQNVLTATVSKGENFFFGYEHKFRTPMRWIFQPTTNLSTNYSPALQL